MTERPSTADSTTHRGDRVVILGGGFGGLHAALRLAQLPWHNGHSPEITLVDRSDRFVFLPLLYELVTGELETWEIAPSYDELLADTPIRFIQGSVTVLDLDGHRVTLADGQHLPYDRLILALGGETPMDTVPGAADHALPFRSLADAYRLGDRLRALERSGADKIRVAVIGGGYSGVELACKLADRLGDRGRLRLVERGDRLLSNSPEFNRTAADRALEKRSIWIDWETSVERIEADTLYLNYRGTAEAIPVDLVLWTVGNRIPALIQNLPLQKGDRGQLLTDATLQIRDRADLFAIGDLAEIRDADGTSAPSTGQAAMQQGDYAAWNVWASLRDRPLLPFRYQNLGEMLALGNDSATLTGLGLELDGPLAYLARRLVYLYRMPSPSHQLKVGLNWVARPLLDALGLNP